MKVHIACMRGQQRNPAERHSASLLLAAVPVVIAGVSLPLAPLQAAATTAVRARLRSW